MQGDIHFHYSTFLNLKKKILGKSTYKLWFSKSIIDLIVSDIKLDNYMSVDKLTKLNRFLFLDCNLSSILLLYLEPLILQNPHNLRMCIIFMIVNSIVRERTN